jgi:hypothetical protein
MIMCTYSSVGRATDCQINTIIKLSGFESVLGLNKKLDNILYTNKGIFHICNFRPSMTSKGGLRVALFCKR